MPYFHSHHVSICDPLTIDCENCSFKFGYIVKETDNWGKCEQAPRIHEDCNFLVALGYLPISNYVSTLCMHSTFTATYICECSIYTMPIIYYSKTACQQLVKLKVRGRFWHLQLARHWNYGRQTPNGGMLRLQQVSMYTRVITTDMPVLWVRDALHSCSYLRLVLLVRVLCYSFLQAMMQHSEPLQPGQVHH